VALTGHEVQAVEPPGEYVALSQLMHWPVDKLVYGAHTQSDEESEPAGEIIFVSHWVQLAASITLEYVFAGHWKHKLPLVAYPGTHWLHEAPV